MTDATKSGDGDDEKQHRGRPRVRRRPDDVTVLELHHPVGELEEGEDVASEVVPVAAALALVDADDQRGVRTR